MKKPSLALALGGALVVVLALGFARPPAQPLTSQASDAEPDSYAQYLANAGVLVVHGETKIAFDPIFRSSFGSYLLLSEELERSLFAGEPPFDGLDAVFISHHHGDHFSPKDVLRLMTVYDELKLFAPKQAVDAIRRIHRTQDTPAGGNVFGRVQPIDLDYEDEPLSLQTEDILVEAVRIPHSGWPTRMQDVENIAFRVSLEGSITAAHLGDADVRDEHFDHDAGYWARRPLDVAFPPYWYLQSEDGRAILSNRLDPALTVGVHVPKQFSDDERETLTRSQEGISLFTEPLERRELAPAQ